ncbi:MAG: threonine synthase [Rhodospirillales bacterium]|nr:threonine synthase [Rhodospirillales bacterium]
MTYVSTRGQAPVLAFDDVLLAGLARDGGLYVPQEWPRFSAAEIRALAGLPYAELATRVMLPFLDRTISEDDFAALVADSYAGFGHAAVAPLKQLDRGDWLLELFHGPTLAFKDYALQLLGRLFDHVLARRGARVTIVGATSGDTGSAAIEACRDRAAIDIVILHPKGRVSEVQRRQMTTVLSSNVHNVAVEGTFDDCQDLVKALFNDQPFRDEMALSAVNSINWARIMAQIVYYFAAGTALGAPERPVSFAVPTGNFGNVYAGYGARAMGLPVEQFVVGSNRNDILTRFFDSGEMALGEVMPTLSPSMDIQVSSNFERLLFDLYDRDGAALADVMARFRATGAMNVGAARWKKALELFDGFRLDDDGTQAVIRDVYRATGELLDPHSAVGVAAGRARRRRADIPMISLATAHPAKFPAAVEAATGIHPALPARLADLFERPERCDVLPNDVAVLKDYVKGKVAKVAA